MSNVLDLDRGQLVSRLRADPLVRDAELMPGDDDSADLTVFIVPQGFTAGHALRELVMRLAGPAGERAQVVLTFAIARDESGRLDLAEAAAAMSQPDMVLRFVPASTEAERSLAGLVRQVLADVAMVSMTDSLVTLGCDSVSAVELVAGIRDTFGVDIDPHDVFNAESLGELAARLAPAAVGPMAR
jgi:acyl carrier protein